MVKAGIGRLEEFVQSSLLLLLSWHGQEAAGTAPRKTRASSLRLLSYSRVSRLLIYIQQKQGTERVLGGSMKATEKSEEGCRIFSTQCHAVVFLIQPCFPLTHRVSVRSTGCFCFPGRVRQMIDNRYSSFYTKRLNETISCRDSKRQTVNE